MRTESSGTRAAPFEGGNQVSSDEGVVAAAFRPEHKETFITAAGVREEGGRGGGGICCAVDFFF